MRPALKDWGWKAAVHVSDPSEVDRYKLVWGVQRDVSTTFCTWDLKYIRAQYDFCVENRYAYARLFDTKTGYLLREHQQ